MKNTGQDAGATSVADAAGRAEPTIVRDLLFGGAQRSIESRLAELQQEMHAAIKHMQAQFTKEMEAMQARVNELEQETEKKRLASVRDIGAAISELGASVTALGSERPGK